MAERLGSGLQNHVLRFKSGSCLHSFQNLYQCVCLHHTWLGRDGRAVRQWSAKPCTPVQIRIVPPFSLYFFLFPVIDKLTQNVQLKTGLPLDIFSLNNSNEPPAGSLTDSTIRAEVKRIVFASDDGAYCVVRLNFDDREITAVGSLSAVSPGQEIAATGSWESHKTHGRQFRVKSFKAVLPTTVDGIQRYLSSGIIPGLGKKTAEKIVNHFMEDTITVLDNYSVRLKEIEGIGKNKIAQIKKGWDELKQHRELDIFLQSLGVSPSHCRKIREQYQNNTPQVVKHTPYKLATDIRGIGFLTADRIALAQGMEKSSPVRIAAGIIHALGELASGGHSCYPQHELCDYAAGLLQVAVEDVIPVLPACAAAGTITIQTVGTENFIYLRGLYQAEHELAEKIKFLLNIPDHRKRLQNPHVGDNFSEKQRLAVVNAFNARLSIITGGPGVGKTTVVGEIVKNARAAKMKIYLAAPTGRAAKRMSESCHLAAQTIHRLLKWDAAEGAFAFNEDNPLNCDILIVDEVSMLDVSLARHLFRAVELKTTVVLVGDRDQLPSVGPGNVLHDMIASGQIPVTNLDEIFRQAADSHIITNAHLVNAQKLPNLTNPPRDALGDFYWIEQPDPERINEIIIEMISKRIPERFGLNPYKDVQVLTPMNNGISGTVNLNKLIQEALNPGGKSPQFKSGDRIFRLNDKVMQRVNNYDKSVFNGDLGYIRKIDLKAKTFVIEYDDKKVDYEFGESDQIMPAYAITVHKSQGCEFPAVIVPVMTQHFVMLQKNLLYTAMTRAKKLLILIGTKKALQISTSNSKIVKRYSNLELKIKS